MAETNERELTKQQQMFVDAYLCDPELNGAECVRKAGYKTKYPGKLAFQLLENARIKDVIQKAMNKRAKRTEIKADDVLNVLHDILQTKTTDIVKVVTRRGIERTPNAEGEMIEREYEYQAVEIKDTLELTEGQKQAIASIKQGKEGIEIKLHDKMKAVEFAGKHLGMFVDKVEVKSEVINRHEYHIEQVITSDPESVELLKQLYKRAAVPAMGDTSQA